MVIRFGQFTLSENAQQVCKDWEALPHEERHAVDEVLRAASKRAGSLAFYRARRLLIAIAPVVLCDDGPTWEAEGGSDEG